MNILRKYIDIINESVNEIAKQDLLEPKSLAWKNSLNENNDPIFKIGDVVINQYNDIVKITDIKEDNIGLGYHLTKKNGDTYIEYDTLKYGDGYHFIYSKLQHADPEDIKKFNTSDDERSLQNQKILHTLQTECSEILKIYKSIGQVLYRGLRAAPFAIDDQYFIHKEINQNREPLELGRTTHKYFNKILSDMGFSAHRGNSIFTTPRIFIAESWGEPFIIFPTNGFKYTWFENSNGNYVFDSIYGIRNREKLESIITELKPTSTNIENAILTNNEVLIQSDKGYYAMARWLFNDYFEDLI